MSNGDYVVNSSRSEKQEKYNKFNSSYQLLRTKKNTNDYCFTITKI